MNIIIVAAHPDDETLGMGGTIAKHIAQKDIVKILILGTGVTSRDLNEGKKDIEKLRLESRKALSKLGVSDVEFFDFPDNKFDSVPLLEIIKRIETVFSNYKPEVVYTHHEGDLNIDHRVTFNAVITACRPSNNFVKKILCFEVPSSTEWNFQNGSNAFLPNVYIDISKYLEKKLSALNEYKGEMRPWPHPRSIKAVESLALWRGSTIGVDAGEAFELVREII